MPPSVTLSGVLPTEYGDMPWSVSFFPGEARPYTAWAKDCAPMRCESLDRALAAVKRWSEL